MAFAEISLYASQVARNPLLHRTLTIIRNNEKPILLNRL